MEVTKRDMPQVSHLQRFRDIELRIGDNDESTMGRVQFWQNPLVAFYPGNNGDLLAVFDVEGGGASGKFLTLQSKVETELEIAEIDVSQ